MGLKSKLLTSGGRFFRKYFCILLLVNVLLSSLNFGSPTTIPLYFINGSRTLGANESDVRCLGDVVSGTASFSKALVMAHQRFYRYTPSQCASCATRLGRQLPPTCMRRVYADNLDVLQVRCAHAGQLFGVNATGVDRQAPPGSVSLLVVDAEGEDDRVVARMLAILGGEAPSVLVYEQR